MLGLAASFGVLLIGVLSFPQAAQAQGNFDGAFNTGDPWIDIGGAPVNVSISVWATHNDPAGKELKIEGVLRQLDSYAYVNIVDGGGCTPEGDATLNCGLIGPGDSRTVTFSITPMAESDLPQGQQKTGKFKVKFNNGDKELNVTVNGAAAASMSSLSGQVTSNAEPVEGAKIKLTDGDGRDHEQTTGGDGSFNFTGDGSNPLVAGDMKMVITKDGYEDKTEEFNVPEGSTTFTRTITLSEVKAEESSAPPTSAPPPTTEEEVAAPEPEESGVSGTLIFLIVVGALLVIGGIVGIVFLLRGGKDDKDEDDDDNFAPDGPPDHQPTAAQVGSPGVYQAGPAPGSDAPTMIHPGGLVDGGAATQFGPAYGGDDSTQVMPQSGFGAPPSPLGPDGTTILPVVKQPGGPGGADATQIMPQANLSQPPSAFADPRGAQPPAGTNRPGSFADPGATQPHPGAGSFADPGATQSHPGAGSFADPGATQSHPGAGSFADPGATQPHPGASSFSDPGATRPHPNAYGSDPGATRPSPSPTPPPSTGSMFDPQNPGIAPGAPSEPGFGSHSAPGAPSEPGFGSHGAPSEPGFGSQSAPQYGPGSQSYSPQGGQPAQGFGAGYGSQPGTSSYGSQPSGFGSQPDQSSYGSQPGASSYGSQPGTSSFGSQPDQSSYGSQPGASSYGSQPGGFGSSAPSSDPHPSQSMRRDPYAPPEQPPAPPTGEFGATRAMPQHGNQSQPPAAPYGGEPNRDDEDQPDSRRSDRRNWGEWDDRPRSW
ncbi:carboxypeptidase regulatory-like domain-containing protein [Glycomyces sp. NPDC046736]|uniref:carboxypeptidase regulatory-like domain-containing protein n=1 Tax=Glycomyces sp. NPDC046736 TaxID=3155615 RepID=UPI00340BBF2F